MTIDFFELFCHGSEYEGELDTENVPRSKPCNSCAYTECKGTVRPTNVSLEDMYKNGNYFDVFYCHTPDKDGKNKICAAWYKKFGENCLARMEQTNKEIAEIINS